MTHYTESDRNEGLALCGGGGDMKKPCLSCGVVTEWREGRSERYFCRPLCQKNFYPKAGMNLSSGGGGGGGGGGGKLDKIRKMTQPDFVNDALWDRITEDDSDEDNDPESILEDLVHELEIFMNRIQILDLTMSLNILKNAKKELAQQQLLMAKVNIDFPSNDTNTDESIKLMQHHLHSFLLDKTQVVEEMNKKKYKKRLKEMLDESEVAYGEDDVEDYEEYSQEELLNEKARYQSYIEPMTMFIIKFRHASLNVEKSEKKKVELITIEEEDEKEEVMIVEETKGKEKEEEEEEEVKKGLTKKQWEIFSEMKQAIIEREKDKICVKYVTSYLKSCDVIMPLNLTEFLKRSFDTVKNELELHPENVAYRQQRLEADRKYFPAGYESLRDDEKVKYGVLNWSKEKKGSTQFVQETTGQSLPISFLIFKESVKRRATYSRYETLTNGGAKATFKNYNGTVNHLCFISTLFESSVARSMYNYKGNGANSAMNYSDGYMEIQLHGELVVARDVERIMIASYNETDKSSMERLLSDYFKKISHSIPYEFI